MKKTILLVAIPDSIHTCRWIRQMNNGEWDVHLFSSIGGAIVHPEISGAKFHHPLFVYSKGRNVRLMGRYTHLFARIFDFIRRRVLDQFFPNFRARQLSWVIKKIRPDLVHSMEIQAAGYLTMETKKHLGKFPPWLVTNWGSDIYLFGRIKGHRERIAEILESCEYYSCECERDIWLARAFGFSGETMAVFPNTGGFELSELEPIRSAVKTSARKVIMLKGYQNWAGRALFGLRALEQCADLLQGYEVVVYSADDATALAAELFGDRTGVAVRVLKHKSSHQEMLEWHSRARISIGLSISDAISTSLLEAMVMGSFPIQSCTACADEWLQPGVSGLIVPPEAPEEIEKAIRMALMNDDLVDKAAVINWQVAQTRLDSAFLSQKAAEMYARLLNKSGQVIKPQSLRRPPVSLRS